MRKRAMIFLIIFVSGIVNASAQANGHKIRLAKLVIDTSQLENYRLALKEEIETSLRIEPGVITLYAVAERNSPTHITILEIYASEAAYKSHILTPHFLKYKTGTKEMVKSLELIEADAIVPELKLKAMVP